MWVPFGPVCPVRTDQGQPGASGWQTSEAPNLQQRTMPNHTTAYQDSIIEKAAGAADQLNEAMGRLQAEIDHIDAAGTISDLLNTIAELDKKISERDETITALEQQISDLEANQ